MFASHPLQGVRRGRGRIRRPLGALRTGVPGVYRPFAARSEGTRSTMRPLKSTSWFTRFAKWTARATGKPLAFGLAVAVILVWAITGPLFQFSDTWQLVINTGTTIVTFLMVFLIQNSQNRDNVAIQVKLDELIRVSKVHNMFVGIEHLTEEEIDELRKKCEARASKTGQL